MCCNISAIHIWKGTVLARFAQDITANMDQSGGTNSCKCRGKADTTSSTDPEWIRIQEGKNYPLKQKKFIKFHFFIFFSFIFTIFGHQNPGSGTGTLIRIHLKCWMLDTEPNPDPQHCFYEIISFSCPSWDLLMMQIVCSITINRSKIRNYTVISCNEAL